MKYKNETFYGKILDLFDSDTETTDVLIYLGLPGKLELRRFEPELFSGFQKQEYVKIQIISSLNSKTIRILKILDQSDPELSIMFQRNIIDHLNDLHLYNLNS